MAMIMPWITHTNIYADNIQQSNSPINGKLSNTVHYSLNTVTGVLVISETGNIPDYDYCVEDYENGPEYIMFRNQIKSVVIEEGITRIGRQAFFNCKNLTQITMPDTLESIGECAIKKQILKRNGNGAYYKIKKKKLKLNFENTHQNTKKVSKIKISVRAYKKENGKTVYTKWSKKYGYDYEEYIPCGCEYEEE